jgi:mono/diheme cytochrome c family protein
VTRRLAWLAAALGVAVIACGTPPEPPQPRRLVFLDQGWSNKARDIYYYTPQGTELHRLRYEWFRYLELAGSRERLADPHVLSRFGFLYAPEQFTPGYEPPPFNPANLPVGLTHHRDAASGEAMLDIGCATCHTGQLEYRGTSLRVDGGPARHALASVELGQFAPTLMLALQATLADPFKFDRFARNVLGVSYPDEKPALRADLGAVIDAFAVEAYHGVEKGLWPVQEGWGRIDALDHIANTVFGDDLDPDNYKVGNAPVSLPHLWDIWRFDWVQWNGSAAQPMARNVGEAIGVKARLELLDAHGNPLPPKEMYDSSVLIRELYCQETILWHLRPPRWREDVLPPIDHTKLAKGRKAFRKHCEHCHGPHVQPPDPHATPSRLFTWKMTIVPTTEIGTDPQMADNFVDYRYDASALDPENPRLDAIDAGPALGIVTGQVIERAYDALRLTPEQRRKYDNGRRIQTQSLRGYKARPLHGIWATGPFLHNGSVPTVYDLLLPEERRPRTFHTGAVQFDPVHLGLARDDPPAGAFLFDTTLPGNRNTGHQFRDDGGAGVIGPALSDRERFAIIEYLKVMGNPAFGDFPDDPPGPHECPRTLQGPAGARS